VVALQEEATNHPQVAAVKSRGGERCGRKACLEHVRCDPMKANESEPPLTCRNELDDIKTRLATLAWDESGGSLSTAQTVSGMEVARAWVRLLHGTWEPVVPRDGLPLVFNRWLAGYGRSPSGRNREDQSTDAGHRGGPSGSSDEGSVMGLERSGWAVQARPLGNRVAVGRTNG
jgi:hypothetical protein